METKLFKRLLSEHLNVPLPKIERIKYDHYGLELYGVDGEEWAIGTDKQATNACIEYIRDSVWAFNASFLLAKCNLPRSEDAENALRKMQEDACESANPFLLALVEKCCGLKKFAAAAIEADGRGHFLSSYDGNEVDIWNGKVSFYAYRVN